MPKELEVKQLCRTLPEEDLTFETTEELPPLEEIIGQERALKALEFGVRLKDHNFHIFVVGPPGTGRTTTARELTSRWAKIESIPDDWCYLFNFDSPDNPLALRLPPGTGAELSKELEDLVEIVKEAVPKAFESPEYDEQKNAILQKLRFDTEALMNDLGERAREAHFGLKQTPAGFVTMPLKDDEPMTKEEFSALPEDERHRIEEESGHVQLWITEALHQIHQLERKARADVQELEEKIGNFIISPHTERLTNRFTDFPQLVDYFRLLEENLAKNLDDFKAGEDGLSPAEQELAHRRYLVNLFVDHRESEGAPVIIESNPTYYNLFGRIEYRGSLGSLITDHTMIRNGSLQRANGGYLIIQAIDLLRDPMAYEALKRALRTGLATVENIGEQYRIVPTATLKPEPTPLKIKVVLIGSYYLFEMLNANDEDFRKLFKIKAEFESSIPWSSVNIRKYASFIGDLSRRKGLRPFERSAVCRVLEEGSRIAGTQKRLTADFSHLAGILYEADAWAQTENSPVVKGEHVQRAVNEQTSRSNLIEQRLQEMVEDGKILLEADGEAIGQLNGLTVMSIGNYMFGHPVRITARSYLGDRGVVNIEREAQLSGNLHSKGVLTLSGYLAGRYGRHIPLSLSVSLGFEQMYEEVDGDSASSAELYAILSDLADLPLRQDLAVTGSVDQRGRIQPIGGVTQKVEGFFRVCRLKGLTGRQGVIIPVQNVTDLSLRDEVVQAVEAGNFHIYPVQSIDEGISLLTGTLAGEAGTDGHYPIGTVHERVYRRLFEMAETMATFANRH